VKARRYAALGIPHYWIVDPEARRIECYRVDSGAYAATREVEGDATLAPPDWPGLTIALSDLWR
jgi:Uma2 family endonuclease